MSVSPDFYNANSLSPYPFVGELNNFSRSFIDASVGVHEDYVNSDIAVTYIVRADGSERQIEVVSGTTILISRDDDVIVEDFGENEIWVVSGDYAYGSFVVDPSIVDGVYDDSSGMVLNQHVISSTGESRVSTVLTTSEEIAGPGQLLTIELGSHMSASVSGNTIHLEAEYRYDGPCVPDAAVNNGVKTINGVPPNKYGDFTIAPKKGGTFVIANEPAINSVRFINTAEPCCDCEDYERFFEYAKVTHGRLEDIHEWYKDNRKEYIELMYYLKYLLNVKIVDASLDDDFEAECP